MSEGERLKYFRKEVCHKTQKEFASKLSIGRSNLANIEIGKIRLTDRIINDMARIYSLNPDWIRTGEGSPVYELTQDQQLADMVGELFSNEVDEKKKEFFLAMAQLPDEFFDKMVDAFDKVRATRENKKRVD